MVFDDALKAAAIVGTAIAAVFSAGVAYAKKTNRRKVVIPEVERGEVRQLLRVRENLAQSVCDLEGRVAEQGQRVDKIPEAIAMQREEVLEELRTKHGEAMLEIRSLRERVDLLMVRG